MSLVNDSTTANLNWAINKSTIYWNDVIDCLFYSRLHFPYKLSFIFSPFCQVCVDNNNTFANSVKIFYRLLALVNRFLKALGVCELQFFFWSLARSLLLSLSLYICPSSAFLHLWPSLSSSLFTVELVRVIKIDSKSYIDVMNGNSYAKRLMRCESIEKIGDHALNSHSTQIYWIISILTSFINPYLHYFTPKSFAQTIFTTAASEKLIFTWKKNLAKACKRNAQQIS